MSGQHNQEWIDSACKACEGLTQDHFDGGWTAKELCAYAKRKETELAAARARIASLEAAIDKLAACKGRYHTEANFKELLAVREGK